MSKVPDKKKEKEITNIVWPWDLKHFLGTPADKSCVLENLTQRNFPLYRAEDDRPAERTITVTREILLTLYRAKVSGGLPWMVVFSNDAPLLQAVAILAPVTHALSTMESCAVTSTSLLMDCFQTRRNSRDLDLSEDLLEDMETAGFLTWENPTETVMGLTHQSDRFASLLRYRLRNKLCTLFTVPYAHWIPKKTVKNMFDLMERNLGSSVASMLNQVTNRLNIKITVPVHQVENLKLP